ncbi:MAG: hypothetical protein PVS3B3_17720 [Ktedonobacteraceae bacterium]
MLETLLLGGVIGLIVAIVASFISLKIHQRSLHNTVVQQQGWERAQEARQQQWQIQQEKRSITIEKKLSVHVRQVQQEWKAWEKQNALREQELKRQYKALTIRATLENTVEHIPYLEEASLPLAENQHRRTAVARATPAQLEGADLTGRDLSRRYLGGANLRGATLAYANLFMTDLSGACLAGADLTGADLSGANLIGADFREATLVGANVMVADLNNAILLGANLLKVRNLTAEQTITTIHDSTTQFGEDNDITLPRIPSIPESAPPTSSISSIPQATTAAYDIVRAQSLDAIPESPLLAESEQRSPFLPFPDMLSDTPFPVEDDLTETSIPIWVPTPSNETLRILEEFHFPGQEHRRTENFGISASQEKRVELRQVRAS